MRYCDRLDAALRRSRRLTSHGEMGLLLYLRSPRSVKLGVLDHNWHRIEVLVNERRLLMTSRRRWFFVELAPGSKATVEVLNESPPLVLTVMIPDHTLPVVEIRPRLLSTFLPTPSPPSLRLHPRWAGGDTPRQTR